MSIVLSLALLVAGIAVFGAALALPRRPSAPATPSPQHIYKENRSMEQAASKRSDERLRALVDGAAPVHGEEAETTFAGPFASSDLERTWPREQTFVDCEPSADPRPGADAVSLLPAPREPAVSSAVDRSESAGSRMAHARRSVSPEPLIALLHAEDLSLAVEAAYELGARLGFGPSAELVAAVEPERARAIREHLAPLVAFENISQNRSRSS